MDAVDQSFEAGQRVAIHLSVFQDVLELAPASAWQVAQDDGCPRILLAGLRTFFDEAALPHGLRSRGSSKGGGAAIRVEQVALDTANSAG